MTDTDSSDKKGLFSRLIAWSTRVYDKSTRIWTYVSSGVWRDLRPDWRIKVIKTANLSIRSLLNADLQNQACSLTYRTVLAVIPALALLFAICRGFGFQNLLQDQLFSIVPAQRQALEIALRFVDSYLSQASQGVFVGIGILFLLWTLISLLSSVEDSFNSIWHVKIGRTLWRKITDYLAIFFILPILMICAGGITIVMSTTLQKLVIFDFLGPVVKIFVDALGLVLTWLFFAGAYMLIPNARVKFVNAIISGAFVGTTFQIIQWLFITGQIYVTKYNAIYGSFSFIPLLLIWLQLSWLVTLIGAQVCYASQNLGFYSYYQNIDNISLSYRRKVTLAIMAIIVRRFSSDRTPLTVKALAESYSLPERLVINVVNQLKNVGLISFIEATEEHDDHLMLPAIDPAHITVASTIGRLDRYGDSNFIPEFDLRFKEINAIADRIVNAVSNAEGSTLLADIEIPADIDDDLINNQLSS